MEPSPLVRRITESDAGLNEVKPVIKGTRQIEVLMCPHCQQEILEKHMYWEAGVDRHRDCGGAIQMPPFDWSTVSPEWRALLEPHARKT